MSEEVETKIFLIVAPENLYFDSTLTALRGVIFKIWRKLA